MIVAGLLGMASKFTECTLGVKYRNEYADGTVSGGPMYYMTKGFKERNLPGGRFLAIVFAIFTIGGALGGGNMFQANQAHAQITQITGDFSGVITGVIFAVIVFFGILPGIAIAIALSITELLVRLSRPHEGVLGFVPGMAGMHDVDDYPEAEQIAILKRLGCRVEGEGPTYRVTPPSHRLDLRLEEDLVEEVARIQGYETIPLALPAFFPAPDNRGVEAPYRKEQRLREVLSGLGFQEVYTYSFMDPEDARRFRLDRFRAGQILDEEGTGSQHNLH